jgi:hypothetical protein
MKPPSLFKYATSELSQDAFICWLLSWASPENKDIDAKLHNCGLELIKAFFEKHPQKQSPTAIEKIQIKKQDSNIDVLCIVNDKFAIIIEDKTHTENHHDQLANYLSKIEKRSYEKDNIFPIYFKTYDQASYTDITANKYQVFSRSDFLSILNRAYEAGVNNAIFQDFRTHLQKIENNVQSYQSLPIGPIDQWHSQSWVGFYLKLQKILGTGLWKKVNNEAGGFMGFWWGNKSGGNCKPYLLLEEKKLCFKIKVDDPTERRKLRSKWYKLIKSKSPEFELNLEKPDRFGSGKHMTVIMAKEYRKSNQDGCIDMDATIDNLRKAQALLYAIQESV